MVMNANIRLFWSGARASWSNYLVELTPTVFLGFRIPRILLQSLFFVLLAKAAGGEQLARFALIGNAIQTSVFMIMLSMEVVIESEKWNNTFQYLIASPSNWLPIMLGKGMADYGEALFSTTLLFAVLPPILQIHISPIDLLRSVPIILIAIASASALGWLIGAISLPIRWGYMICNWLAYLMVFLCGVNIPLRALPPLAQMLGNILPVTHGLLAIRAVIDGAAYSTVLPLIGKEVLIAIIYGALAWVTFGYRLRVTRQKGSFELV
ncbi:MAG: ABC transporter permease [Chloroflexota bacterium]